MPSLLSTKAMLFFGRHENHIRYVSPSLRTEMSKQVPRSPPRTGFLVYFTQPAVVSVGGWSFSLAWTAAQRSNPRIGSINNVFIACLLRPAQHELRGSMDDHSLPLVSLRIILRSRLHTPSTSPPTAPGRSGGDRCQPRSAPTMATRCS